MTLPGVGDSPFVMPSAAAALAAPSSDAASSDFSAQLAAAIEALDGTAAAADTTTEGLVTGEVDIHEAMVAMEKADLVLRVAGTVRTKVIDAYQQLLQASGG